jgi:2-polyprenyl-3-methyl-5-hydroxy-6-metoxy-1,4-benzoquinol methylase
MLIARHGCTVTASDRYANAQQFLLRNMLRRIGADSLESAGVTYMAPCDARKTELPAGSYDLITSTSVLEHIPAVDIPAVLKECRRLLAASGVCSFLIDYGDHWSYFDRSLPWDNFLRYSEREWSLYNPSLQYQNRLRHSDYQRLFAQAGLHIAHVEPISPAEDVVPVDDATIGSAWFVLGNVSTLKERPS